jgi:hypothetical protein
VSKLAQQDIDLQGDDIASGDTPIVRDGVSALAMTSM